MVVKIMNKQLTIQKIKTKLSLRFIMQFVIVAVVFTLAIVHQQFGIEKAASIAKGRRIYLRSLGHSSELPHGRRIGFLHILYEI